MENLENIAKYCEVEPVHWIGSENNVADLLTRGSCKLDDIGPRSLWQSGPKFLCLPGESGQSAEILSAQSYQMMNIDQASHS